MVSGGVRQWCVVVGGGVVVYGGVWWCMVVCGGVRWCAVLSFGLKMVVYQVGGRPEYRAYLASISHLLQLLPDTPPLY